MHAPTPTLRSFRFAAIGLVACLPLLAAAQSQSTADAPCPSGYGRLDTLCLNSTTGDVVMANVPASPGVVRETGCRPGYWRYGELCMSSDTGDVEMADQQPRAAAKQIHDEGKR